MISKQEWMSRRRILAEKLPANSIALIPSALEVFRNADTQYPFRQSSDFYYLTGFNEPEALLVITSGPDSKSILFNRPRNLHEEQWTGPRLGQDDAPFVLGVDFAYAYDTINEGLAELMQNKDRIYYPIGQSIDWDNRLLALWKRQQSQCRQGIKVAEAFFDLIPILSEMRLIKSPREIDCMRRVTEISVLAHQRAMRAGLHAKFEYELEAEIRAELIAHGCRSLAYESIVAGGKNACVLHYTANNQALNVGELVLIDAGGEFENYAADITRVFPIGGVFSAQQRTIYELVLHAQRAGIACVKPGTKWNDVQHVIVHTLTQGLIDLGILRGSASDLVDSGAYKRFYMHNSGHWLGLDVHDCGRYKIDGVWRELQPGMVLTVEPGLYLDAKCESIEPCWRGIGVRIEDDILVTENGYENLTVELPVDSYEIEAFMRG